MFHELRRTKNVFGPVLPTPGDRPTVSSPCVPLPPYFFKSPSKRVLFGSVNDFVISRVIFRVRCFLSRKNRIHHFHLSKNNSQTSTFSFVRMYGKIACTFTRWLLRDTYLHGDHLKLEEICCAHF